jgi:hypothetical protein
MLDLTIISDIGKALQILTVGYVIITFFWAYAI